MSKCMTFDETIDQRDTCTEITAKDIVGILLEEILRSAVIVSDKGNFDIYKSVAENVRVTGYSRIGDFNITEDFSQQFDEQVSPNYVKDCDRVNLGHNPSTAKQDLNLNSGESFDHSASLLTARENLEFILDDFVKKEEKVKNVNECKVISQEILADNELQIQNGQIHLETNRSSGASKKFLEPARHDYFKKEDIIKDEKIEIEYFNDGKINKIYVPLTKAPSKEAPEFTLPAYECSKKEEEPAEAFRTNLAADRAGKQTEDGFENKKTTERSFTPFTTEELRQVWENGNTSSIVGRWDGDMSTQPEEVVRLMEELVQAYPDASADPNRPRACAFDEEDVKRMIKEIGEINFNQSHLASEDFDLAYHPDGQGDADLESKSFNTKDNSEKTPKGPEEFLANPDPESKSFNKDKNNSKKSLRDFKEIEELSWSFPTEEKEEWNRSRDYLPETEVGKQERALEEYSTVFEGSTSATDAVLLTDSSSYRRQIGGSSKTSEDTGSMDSDVSTDDAERKLNIQYEPTSKERLAEEKSMMREDVAEVEGVQPSASYTVPRAQNGRKDGEERRERSPSSMSFSEAIVGYQSNYKQTETCQTDFKFISEKDSNLISDSVRGSRSANDTVHDFSSDVNFPVGGGASSLGRLQSESYDGTPTVKSFFDRKEADAVLCNSGSFPDKKENAENNSESFRGGSSEANAEGRKKDSSTKSVEKARCFSWKEGKGLKRSECQMDVGIASDNEEENRVSHQVGSDSKLPENMLTKNQSNKTVKSSESDQTHLEPSTSSMPQNENESDEDGARSPQTFRLHSQKMYSGADYNPGNVGANELLLTDSEEAFIESTENVIQIIDPPTTSVDEDYNISFSLLNEVNLAMSWNSKICEAEAEAETETETEAEFSFNSNAEANTTRANEKPYSKQMFSGMTTIGPIKNIDYDPKELTGPEIDFGKVTRITSSRQLAKDLFVTELKTAPSVKILEETDFDEDCSLSLEGDRVDLGSLVNRDIASLTKVQKVREVMSYHPKPDEDFEDDETLTRPRLDLKDVESMTDERYKVPDVSIPLLSFDVETNTQDPDKDFVQNMRLVLSGNCFNNQSYVEDDAEEGNIETSRKQSTDAIKMLDALENLPKAQISTTGRQGKAEENPDTDLGEEQKETYVQERGTETAVADFGGTSDHHKYGTLGTVFKKASGKLIGKDGDLYVRSSKSLPRDATKLTTTDSIKSILDECHSSASNVLKKSRSLLKNTQSIFKTISQSRFNLQDSSGNLEKQKPSPSESEIGYAEKKLSSFLRKEDFSRAKILIKSKVEKTFKNFEGPRTEQEIAPDKRDLKVVVRNEENYRVDKIENFRKLLPKSHLVYKSQFVKSQVSVSDNAEPSNEPDNKQNFEDPCSEALEDEEKTERIAEEESESTKYAKSKEKTKIPVENKLREGMAWINQQQKLYAIECEPEQPGFIVMETVLGLPVPDFETSSLCELEKIKIEKAPSERGKNSPAGPTPTATPASDDLRRGPAGKEDFSGLVVVGDDRSPRFSDEDELKEKTFKDKKIRPKNKKLSARIRSFWCSAFGRAKTPPAKTNPS